MYNALPFEIDPFRLASQGAKFKGSISLAELPRLREVLSDVQGVAEVMLEIGKEDKRVYIRGKITTAVELVCQRCGEPVVYDINLDLKLSPVSMDAQAANIPSDYEPWVTDDKPVLVTELVEEELLLGLPMIAKHRPEECQIGLPRE